jgi:hypothetical protein
MRGGTGAGGDLLQFLHWEAVDWGLFTGNAAATKILAKRKIDFMKEHRTGRMIMPDCGGGSYGCKKGMKECVLEDPNNAVSHIYLYDYLQEIIMAGRIKLDKSVNVGKVFTWHDSCKHGRELERSFGHGYYEEPRWIIQQCVDEFVDMYPNRANNFCCGAGGGNWPSPYEEDSAWHGRYKYNQIKESGANVVVVGCSNCHDQIMKRLPKFYKDYPYEVKYIWELVADSLVIEPWSPEEIERAEAEAQAQWEKLGVDLDQYAQGHLPGSIETNAFPVKTEEEKARLDKAMPKINASSDDVVILCPKGKLGAENTFNYYKSKGVAEKRLLILENGMAGWPYPKNEK